MGTREQCSECGKFFIEGQEDEECPHEKIESMCPKCNGYIKEDEETVTLTLHRDCSDELHLTDKY